MVNPPAALSGSPVGAAAHRRQRGFSLLELMVVLMVVVLVTTLVNLSVSSGGQDIQLQSQVRSLADVASYALDEAQMTGVDYGLLAAIVTLFLIPIFFVTFLLQNQLLRGVTFGTVKK